MYAVHDSNGKRLAYSDSKGYENEWRKHDDSSFARDVWMLDLSSGEHVIAFSLADDLENTRYQTYEVTIP